METSFIDRGDGIELAYAYQRGRGPCLVFLPGFMSDMTGDKACALADWARDDGVAYLRLDYSGHGQSGGEFRHGTISRWRDDVLFLLDHLALDSVILVGSSMGGWLALLVALANPQRVRALIGIAAAPDFTQTLLWDKMSDETRAAILRDGEWRTPSAYGGEQIFTRALIDDGARHGLLGDKILLSMPIYLLQGMNDSDVPWQIALQICAQVETPQARVILIKDGDHRLSRPQDLALLRQTVSHLYQEMQAWPGGPHTNSP